MSYGTIVDKFVAKAESAYKNNVIDWKAQLKPLFTLYETVPVDRIDKIFKTYTISHIQVPIYRVLDNLPQDDIVIVTVAETKGILMNQWKVNELCTKLSTEIKLNSTAAGPVNTGIEYVKRKHQPLTISHVKMVERTLSTMKIRHKKLYRKFVKELQDVNEVRQTFEEETAEVIETFNNSSKVIQELKATMFHYRFAQNKVFDHLNNVNKLLVEHNGQRFKFTDFLMGIRPTLDAQPQIYTYKEKKRTIFKKIKQFFGCGTKN